MDIVLLAICVSLAIQEPKFLNLENLLNILRTVSMMGLIAFGMTMVIIAKEIDLSVGSTVALCGCIVARLIEVGVPIPLAMMLTIIAGTLLGAFTGFMRVKFEVPSFITTLALFTAERGAALIITKGFPIAITSEWYSYLGAGYLAGIPFPAIIFVVGFLVIHFVMKYTVFGGAVYAVGGNDEAARLSGINVGFVRVMVFAITGGLAAVSGLLMSARIASGSPTLAQGITAIDPAERAFRGPSPGPGRWPPWFRPAPAAPGRDGRAASAPHSRAGTGPGPAGLARRDPRSR